MRTHIDYGIYFNADFCQIARLENGMPEIKRSDTLKESIPLCVSFNKKQEILVGDIALNVFKQDRVGKISSNTYVEFTRTLGTNLIFVSSNTGKTYSSEELLAECFKKLKSFVQDEDIRAVAITVPAKFLNLQNEAVRKSGKLAGFEHIELIPETIAALMSFGLGSKQNNGYYLVFDFQSEFNVSICKFEEGIISIKDTDGDNWLGDKNIIEAIVDEIIIPYLKENYKLDFILNDANKKEVFRNALKLYAEEAKEQLNSKESHNILSGLGDLPFEDENGYELKIDIELTQQDLSWISRPIYQKAIDITFDLLKRNNLKGKDLHCICLVGNGTYSSILRRMLKEQVTDKVDTSVDPNTVFAKGAALFASTISVSDEIKYTKRDITKLQLAINYIATTVELDEMINIKVLKEKTIGVFLDKIYADIVRFDGTWSSGLTLIGEKARLVDLTLVEGCLNSFEIKVYDEEGNKVECQPYQFSILQGIGGLNEMQVLPYHIGIAKYFAIVGKELFLPIKGLEKNKSLPAIGVINGFKTKFDLIPEVSSDIIRIPIYQGDYNAEGTNPSLNNHVVDIVISGETLPFMLPAGSDIDFTIKVDTSQLMTFTAYIPYLNHTVELEVEIKQTELVTLKIIDDLKGELVLFYSDNPAMGKEMFSFLLKELIRVEKKGFSESDKLKVLDSVKKEILRWT